MTQKASTYQPICLARLPLLRNTKLRRMRFSRSDRDHSDSAGSRICAGKKPAAAFWTDASCDASFDHRRQQAAFTVLQQACEFLQLPLCKPIHLFQHNEVIFHMGDQSIGRIKQLPVEALGIDQVSVLFFQTHRVYGWF